MKANELRIGNLLEVGINVKLESIYSIVQEVNERIILIKDVNILRNMPLDVLRPIPLTEELLLKFGYDWISENHFANLGHLIWKVEDRFYCDKNGVFLKYAHQLQNLYFALTNEELTIKQ